MQESEQTSFINFTHEITFRNTGGFLNTPTPGGVPVRNTSPGVNVTNLTEEEKKHSKRADSRAAKSKLCSVMN